MTDPQRSSLTIQGGPLAGRSFVLPDGVGQGTIGSDPTCNILVPLPGVGARHVLVVRRGAGTFVVDPGSARGVFINDGRIAGEHELRDGDVLWLGPPGDADSVAFKCRLVGQRPAAQPAPAFADDRFVADALGGAEAASQPPADEEAFFVGEPGASAPTAPEERSNAFFVADEANLAPQDVGQAAAPLSSASEEQPFFVQDSASTPSAPAADDFFFSEAPAALPPPIVAIPAAPPAAVGPAPTAGSVRPQPGPSPVTAATELSADAKPARSTAPPVRPVSVGPAAGAAAPAVKPAVSPREPTQARAINARGTPAAGTPRVRPVGPPYAPGARGGVPRGPRPQRSRAGSPAWIWPIVILAGLAIAAGAVYGSLMLVGRPRVDSLEPKQARIGDAVVLTGEHLGTSSAQTIVLFNDKPAQIVASDERRIEAKVPDLDLAPGERRDVGVQVSVGRKRSTPALVQVRKVPRIDGLSPDVAASGEEVLLAGAGWATSGTQVSFDDTPGQVLEIAPAYVRVRVPSLASPQGTTVKVVVASGSDRSEPASLVLGRLPVVTSVEPRSASMGEVVTVRGRGLRSSPTEHTALIGGAPALVVGAADGRIEIMVPAQAPVGEETLELRVRGYANPALTTLMISPATDPIALRFVAEPLSEGGRTRAAVGTALGPVFVLAYSGGRSAAERAAEAVRRLNGATAVLRDQADAALELRLGGPSALIGVAGSREPLLEVTNEDAQAYASTVARGRATAVTRTRLANWWLAELRDIVLLLGRGERPRHTAAFGVDARFITDVYDAAMRGGGPVTHAVVGGLRPAVRDGLRAMALRVPANVPEPQT